jgi:hypothetical protein
MKHSLALLLVSVLTLSCLVSAVYAAPGDLTFTVDVTGIGTLNPGEYIEVPISVSNNPGMAAITGLKISWESNNLLYDDRLAAYNPSTISAARQTWPFTVPAVYSDGGIFEGAFFIPPAEGVMKTDNSITFGFAAMSNRIQNGTMVTLKFKVKDDVASGAINISLSLVSVKTQDGEELSYNLVGGTLTAKSAEPSPEPTTSPSPTPPEGDTGSDDSLPNQPDENSDVPDGENNDNTTQPTDPDAEQSIPPKEIPFVDVREDDWFYEAVKYAQQRNLVAGTSATTFSPQATVTRAMMVTILWNHAGQPQMGSTVFTDVPDGRWYSDAVNWAAANGVVAGVGNNRYAPSEEITREQMAVMLYNYSKFLDAELPNKRTGLFVDEAQISYWAKEAVATMFAAEILNGKGQNNFDPQGRATRAEVVAMMRNFLESIGD